MQVVMVVMVVMSDRSCYSGVDLRLAQATAWAAELEAREKVQSRTLGRLPRASQPRHG
jgi:hypothetical protein